MNKTGKVYLVGAGPGDPALLTIEALRLLQTADVVFHDDLVSPGILALISSETHVESVGKRCGHASVSQQQIHSLMINAAKEGWSVVRLKSGDPLTDRRLASKVLFLSNHQCAGKHLLDWQDAVSEDTTALIYMPGADYEELAAKLCADGLRPETPCLIVSHATTREQRMHATTLANLAEA